MFQPRKSVFMNPFLVTTALVLLAFAPTAYARDSDVGLWRSDSTDPCRAHHLRADNARMGAGAPCNDASARITPASAEDLSDLAPAAGGAWRTDRQMDSDSNQTLNSDREILR